MCTDQIVIGAAVFLKGGHVLQQHRSIRGKIPVNGFQDLYKIQGAFSGRAFLQYGGQPHQVHPGILQVGAFDIRSQQAETLLYEPLRVQEPSRAVDHIHKIHVDGKLFPVHILHQLKAGFRAVREHPGHGFQAVEGLFRTGAVDDLPEGGDQPVVHGLREIAAVRCIPAGGAFRTGNVDAAGNGQFIGQFQLADGIFQVRAAFGGIKHIFPNAHFRDGHIMFFRDPQEPLDFLPGSFTGKRCGNGPKTGLYQFLLPFRGIVAAYGSA